MLMCDVYMCVNDVFVMFELLVIMDVLVVVFLL